MKNYSAEYIEIWGRLRNIIESRGLDYREVASGVGVSYSYLMNFFNLHKTCKLHIFLEICKYCSVDPKNLLEKQERKEGMDLALVQHIDLVRLFADKAKALRITRNLIELENYGLLDYIARIVDVTLEEERAKHPKDSTIQRG